MSSDEERGSARPDARGSDGPEVIGEAPTTAMDHETHGYERPTEPQPVAWPAHAPTQPMAGASAPTAVQQPLPHGAPPPADPGRPVNQQDERLNQAAAAPVDPWAQPTGDPWIDVTPGSPTAETVGTAPDSRGRRIGGAVGLFAAGAVAGALVTGIFTGWGSNDATALTSQTGQSQGSAGQPGAQPPGQSQAGQQPGAGQNGQPGTGQNGTGQNGTGQGLNGFGGRDGEIRLVGTLTAVSSSKVTVRSPVGSGTYTIESSTRILRDGAQAEASDLHVGDVALVHAFPSSGTDGVLELIYARSAAGGSGSGSGDSSSSGSDDGSTT
jgi:hypothetical protein